MPDISLHTDIRLSDLTESDGNGSHPATHKAYRPYTPKSVGPETDWLELIPAHLRRPLKPPAKAPRP